jgi:membrane dipeptidase
MIVDISHVSDKTFYDVLEVSSKPVMASHSSCFVYSDIPRDMKDDMFPGIGQVWGRGGREFRIILPESEGWR